MVKLIYIILLSAVLWSGIIAPRAMAEGDTSIEIATGEQPPHTSSGSPHYGYLNHIVTLAFEQVGIKAEYVFMPWPRAYKETEEGRFLASSYWYRDPRHESSFYISEALVQERVVFFRKKSSLTVNNFNDVKRLRLRVGLTRGYTYMEDLWRYARENASLVSVVNTELQNFRMLLLGRIDVFPAEEISGWYALNQNFSAEQVRTIETLNNELFSREATVLFSKANPEGRKMQQAFNKGLQIARDKGLLEALENDFITGKYTSALKPEELDSFAENDFSDP